MDLIGYGVGLTILIVLILIWEMIWKSIALWKSARNDQKAWFVCLIIFNTAGILPILYIFLFQKISEEQEMPIENTEKPVEKPVENPADVASQTQK